MLQGYLTGTGVIISYDYPSVSKTTLMNIIKCITWTNKNLIDDIATKKYITHTNVHIYA